MNEKEIMQYINDALKEKNITNYAIAKKMKKSKTTITKWLTGITYPDLPDLLRLLEIAEIKFELSKF